MAKLSHFRYALRFFITIPLLLLAILSGAQTLGGAAAFSFLSFPASAQAGASGGINISKVDGDVSFSMQNPALLHSGLHGQAAMHFTHLSANIKALQLAAAHLHKPSQTTFGGSIFFIHYGSMQQTDAAGNVSGTFNAYDYVVQASAGKKYGERWQYGASIKWIQSLYGQYKASALAADVGLVYNNSTNGWQGAVVAKNMGVLLAAFGSESEELPFDLQLGFTKKLKAAPLAFSATAHHLHRFSLLHNDTLFNRQNNIDSKPSFFKRVFNHFVFATHVYIGQHLEATIGYNVLRRTELSIPAGANGLAGFSAGFSARFQKIGFHYTRSSYQKGISNNQFGLNIHLHQLGGAGTF